MAKALLRLSIIPLFLKWLRLRWKKWQVISQPWKYTRNYDFSGWYSPHVKNVRMIRCHNSKQPVITTTSGGRAADLPLNILFMHRTRLSELISSKKNAAEKEPILILIMMITICILCSIFYIVFLGCCVLHFIFDVGRINGAFMMSIYIICICREFDKRAKYLLVNINFFFVFFFLYVLLWFTGVVQSLILAAFVVGMGVKCSFHAAPASNTSGWWCNMDNWEVSMEHISGVYSFSKNVVHTNPFWWSPRLLLLCFLFYVTVHAFVYGWNVFVKKLLIEIFTTLV